MSSPAYTCTLDAASEKKAKEELHEVPSERLSAVETFSTWIKEQPHINFPTDNINLLLMFLRAGKFSQLKARTILEGYCTQKTAIPDWYCNLHTDDEMIVKVIKLGLMVPIPKRTKKGQRLIIERGAAFDTSYWKNHKGPMMRGMLAICFYMLMDENTQVNGLLFFDDLSGFDLKHQMFWSFDDLKNMHKAWQSNFPARFKGFNLYNAGPFFDAMWALVIPLLSKKFKERMNYIGPNLENVYKAIDKELLPEEYLPDDYKGPNSGSIDSLTTNLLNSMQTPKVQEFLRLISQPQWGLDKSKKLTDQPQASFRKLNID